MEHGDAFDALTTDDLLLDFTGCEWTIIEKSNNQTITIAPKSGKPVLAYSKEEFIELMVYSGLRIKKSPKIRSAADLAKVDPSNKPVINALQEKDYVVFIVPSGSEFLFQCLYTDEKWIYLRMASETEVNYKVDRATGRMRKFLADSWSAVDGKFQHHFQE